MSAFREAPVPSADAVRSIRIAHTLIERYLVLARTQPQSSAQMELVIGEAQQIYPEIWHHLDVARRALVADGRDVAGFDEYRKSELIELGVTDVDFSRELDVAALMLGRIRERTVAGGKRALLAAEVDLTHQPRRDPVELIPAAPAPPPTFVGLGDFDADGSEEVVTADDTHLIVTQIRSDAFVDLQGPTLKAGCTAVPTIEADFRNGNTGQRKDLVLTVDDPHPKKGCPTTGRHFYGLAGGALVED